MINYLEDKDILQRFKVNAFKADMPVATLLAYQSRSIVTIEQILVYDEFRRLGIGTHMITLLETWARENKATKILGPLPICDANSAGDILANYKFFKSCDYKNPFGFLIYKNLTIQAK